MDVVTAASLATAMLAVLLVAPVWLHHRVRRRIAALGEAGQAAPTAPPARPARPPRPVSDLLAGMTLPCELAPLTNVEPPGGPDRLVFVTDWPADRVRADLKGALAAIEFDLQWNAGEGVATRDGDRLRVVVHAAPRSVVVGSRPAFPTAASGTTVVELSAPDR